MTNKYEGLRKSLVEYYTQGMSAEEGSSFVEQLFSKISPNGGGLEEVIVKGSVVHQDTAQMVYSPLAIYFVDWVLNNYSKSRLNGSAQVNNRGNGKILFLARDSIPLYHIAQELIKKKGYPTITTDNLSLVYFTRGVAGQPDEISGLPSVSTDLSLLKGYLQQCGVGKDSLFVDVGLYGSLYRYGQNHLWNGNAPGIVFFYSKNPHITGFLNRKLMEEKGTISTEDADVCDILANSIECLTPQKHNTPTELVQSPNGIITPKLSEIDNRMITSWHQPSVSGYVMGVDEFLLHQPDFCEELDKIAELQQQARQGKYSGLLWKNELEWSKKKEFLDSWNIGQAKSFPGGVEIVN